MIMAVNLILYFSGTGNSLAAAKQIAEVIGDTDVRAMAAYPDPEGHYERVGFVFPCYAYRLPRFVNDYIEKIDTTRLVSDYYFALETFGGSLGLSNDQLDQILRKKGTKLSFAAGVKMFSNYIALHAMRGDADEKARVSAETIARIAARIKDKFKAEKIERSSIPNWFSALMLSLLLKAGKGLWVNTDCSGCGKCAALCPVNSITLESGKPVFTGNCEQCMACIQWCPKQAINYKSKTVGKRRYQHPAVNMDEMLLR